MTASRPSIAFTVYVCACYQANPRASNLHCTKHILKYVSGTVVFCLCFSFDIPSMLVGYYDNIWTGCAEDRKGTSNACFFMGNSLIVWFSTNQNYISLSTAKDEYIATSSYRTQLLWIKQRYSGYDIHQDTIILYSENMQLLIFSCGLVIHTTLSYWTCYTLPDAQEIYLNLNWHLCSSLHLH